jgi:hypothetical protein
MPDKVWPPCTEALQGATLDAGAKEPDKLADKLAGTTNSPPGCTWAAASARVKAGADRAKAKGLRASCGKPEASVLVTVGVIGGSKRMDGLSVDRFSKAGLVLAFGCRSDQKVKKTNT